jgi:hypothetical protein
MTVVTAAVRDQHGLAWKCADDSARTTSISRGEWRTELLNPSLSMHEKGIIPEAAAGAFSPASMT